MQQLENILNLIKDYVQENSKKTTATLIAIVCVLWIIQRIKIWTKQKNYFKKLNINGPTPIPILGNIGMIKRGVIHNDAYLIKTYGKTFGYYEGNVPVVLSTDTKLIKAVMIKDFNCFINRRPFDDILFDPFDKFMIALKDEEWKNVRSIVSTTFTSGKLKSMTRNMKKYSESVCQYFDQIINKAATFNAKKIFSCYALDVICSSWFGLETDLINDQESEFYKNLIEIFADSKIKKAKLIFFFLFPKAAAFLSQRGLVEFFAVKACKYVQSVTDQVIEKRRSKKERKEDFIQNIIEHGETPDDKTETHTEDSSNETTTTTNSLKWKPLKKTLTNQEITAQALLFLIAGYESTASTLAFMAHNLAMNPQYQQILIQEVDQVLAKNNGEASYDAVNEMTYLDMVIYETLRMYPPGVRIDRIANSDFEFEGIKIPKGQVFTIPVWALHHDPEIYPDPDQFNPDRFSESSKSQRDHEAYLAFGAGPRNCIGMRFAMLQIKFLIAKLLSKFEFVKCEQTPEKIEIEMNGLSKTLITLKIKSRF